jgi:CRP-like cAMP-binding protein
MREIAELLDEVPTLGQLEPAHRELIAGCGTNFVARPGEYLFREGDAADTFFAIRRGAVALEVSAPPRAPLIVETLHGGDVLGYSWLIPPYRVEFDARATEEVHAIAFDGTCLRGKCDTDHALGYELMRRFAAVMAHRLQTTRLRLLDVYGADGVA